MTEDYLPDVVLSDLKPLIEDGNLYVLCACTKKSLRSPRAHFRTCQKISKFPGGVSDPVPPEPLTPYP